MSPKHEVERKVKLITYGARTAGNYSQQRDLTKQVAAIRGHGFRRKTAVMKSSAKLWDLTGAYSLEDICFNSMTQIQTRLYIFLNLSILHKKTTTKE